MTHAEQTALIPVAGRSCGSCTLCCKVMAIEELKKLTGQWCEHCAAGKGCRIYDKRPGECRRFHCGYLVFEHLSEQWRPSKCKMVFVQEGERRIIIHVDPGYPTAWQQEPYYSRLKQWARAAISAHAQVAVYIGKRVIVVLPDTDTDLGIVADDELIAVEEVDTPLGPRREAFKINKNDPRAVGLSSESFAAFGQPRRHRLRGTDNTSLAAGAQMTDQTVAVTKST